MNAPAVPSVNDIAQRAAEYPFGKTVARLALTFSMTVFFTIGLLPGAFWFGLVFTSLWVKEHMSWMWDTVVYGFRTGANIRTEPKVAERTVVQTFHGS